VADLPKVGDYTVTRVIGQGGMGRVVQALSPDGSTVAVKTVVWPEGLNSRARWETVERFQREARAARSLTHPNIVRVLDIGADQDTFFIVMEFLDGQSVRELISIAGSVKVDRAVEIIRSACEALAFAHDQGVIHRDIKPDNIMVLRNGTVKLTDFGLASILYERGVTQTGTIMGTFAYMSPEQTKGEKLDPRSDIFSLGATFYEMVTGRQAFQAEGPAALVHKIVTEDPPPVSALPPHISRCLSKCLRKQPAYRFQNAREIIAALNVAAPAADNRITAVLDRSAAPVGIAPTLRVPQRPGQAEAAAEAAKPGARAPDWRCGKCHEPLVRNAATCWRCGTPNPAMAQRTAHKQYGTELMSALQDLKSPDKKSIWRRKSR
jgi:serine/threonine protein kinase